jgi:hypothetical protein
MKRILIYGLLVFSLFLTACYSFKGITIPPEIQFYVVEDYKLNFSSGDNFPSNIEITFAEAMRERIRNESSLRYSSETPDIIFSGTIKSFRVRPAAPVEGSTTSLNRLDINVEIVYEDLTNEENNWRKSYNAFEDFESTEALTSVQEELIELIFTDITERVFNDTFSNW